MSRPGKVGLRTCIILHYISTHKGKSKGGKHSPPPAYIRQILPSLDRVKYEDLKIEVGFPILK